MAIVIKLEEIMSLYGIQLGDLAEAVGITLANMSRLKTGKAVSIRFSTLDALVEALQGLGFADCMVDDLIGYVPNEGVGAVAKGVYVSVPESLHHMSNPVSEAARKRVGGQPARDDWRPDPD